jgi:hypothetical protein
MAPRSAPALSGKKSSKKKRKGRGKNSPRRYHDGAPDTPRPRPSAHVTLQSPTRCPGQPVRITPFSFSSLSFHFFLFPRRQVGGRRRLGRALGFYDTCSASYRHARAVLDLTPSRCEQTVRPTSTSTPTQLIQGPPSEDHRHSRWGERRSAQAILPAAINGRFCAASTGANALVPLDRRGQGLSGRADLSRRRPPSHIVGTPSLPVPLRRIDSARTIRQLTRPSPVLRLIGSRSSTPTRRRCCLNGDVACAASNSAHPTWLQRRPSSNGGFARALLRRPSRPSTRRRRPSSKGVAGDRRRPGPSLLHARPRPPPTTAPATACRYGGKLSPPLCLSSSVMLESPFV